MGKVKRKAIQLALVLAVVGTAFLLNTLDVVSATNQVRETFTSKSGKEVRWFREDVNGVIDDFTLYKDHDGKWKYKEGFNNDPSDNDGAIVTLTVPTNNVPTAGASPLEGVLTSGQGELVLNTNLPQVNTQIIDLATGKVLLEMTLFAVKDSISIPVKNLKIGTPYFILLKSGAGQKFHNSFILNNDYSITFIGK